MEEVNGWQDLMNLLDTLYRMGKARQKAARDAEGYALRQAIAHIMGHCPACQDFFDARWPQLHASEATAAHLNSYAGRN